MADSYVGRFRLIREIGRGGMAVVYLAEDPRLGRNVAIKLIAGQGLADPYFRLAFEREARAIGSLNHPHILPVYDIGEHEGRLYLVMLYVEGGRTLKDALKDGPLPPTEVARLLRQVAHALGHAHAAGLVHRDVKPHNVLVNPSGHAYLADFGLAKAVSAATAALTQTGERGSSGTPIYMSPEQIGSSATIDYRADIYSLGAMAFELLTGTPPYRGEIPAILYQHCFAPIPAATGRNPALPSELDEILRRALAKSPSERFATAWELAEAVGRAVGGEVTGASAPTIPPGVVAVAGIGGARLGHLPVPPTALVGREETAASVVALFRRPDVRLVTLTGPGGIGKTRLSLEVARELESDFPDGACFVPLASLRDPALVAPTIAQSLGLREAISKPVLETLLDTLRGRRLLLVLDNFEQVLEAAPLVAELLAAAPRLAVLVSSRIVLHLRGEYEVSVPLLALPGGRRRLDDERRLPSDGLTGPNDGVGGEDGGAEVASLLAFGAVRLFVERARAVRQEFALSVENAPAVAEICRRLEGHPLAIELAAARVKVLSPRALLDRLERRLPLLAGGHRDLPERHQAIRDTIAWSYDLLREPERVLFRRLGVFAGGFTHEAVEQLGAHLPSAALDPLSALEALVDQSLLRQVETNGEPRFAMLELIREYALERLEASDELATAEKAHLFLYLELAEFVEPRLRGPEQGRWLEQLEREHDNLRSALRHAFDARDEEAALRLAGALWWFWHLRGHLGEGRRVLEEVIARASSAPARFRAKALRGAGVLANAQGDYDRAIDLFEEALSLYRETGDRSGVAASVNSLAEVARTRGEYERAAALYDEALGTARDLGDRRQRAVALAGLGVVAQLQGNYDRAVPLYEESLGLLRQMGDRHATAAPLLNLGNVAWARGELDRAEGLQEESLAIYRALGDKRPQALALLNLAGVATARGDYARGRARYQESLTLYRELGNAHGAALALLGLGTIAQERGEYGDAAARYQECLTLFRRLGDRRHVAAALNNLGEVARERGELDGADAYFEESLRLAHELGDRLVSAVALNNLSIGARRRRDNRRAATLAVQSLRLNRDMGSKHGLAQSLENLGAAAGAQGWHDHALWLLGAAKALRSAAGAPWSWVERLDYEAVLAIARSALGEERFTQRFEEGRALNLDVAADYALRVAEQLAPDLQQS